MNIVLCFTGMRTTLLWWRFWKTKTQIFLWKVPASSWSFIWSVHHYFVV